MTLAAFPTEQIHIFIVDDDPSFLSKITLLLEDKATLHKIEKGQKLSQRALDWIRQRMNNSEPLDVALLDVGLPESNGYDLLKIIHQEYPYLPVVLMTANIQEAEQRTPVEALNQGAKAYLIKNNSMIQEEILIWTTRLRKESLQARWLTLIQSFTKEAHQNKDWLDIMNIVCEQLFSHHMIDSCYLRQYDPLKNCCTLISKREYIRTLIANRRVVPLGDSGLLRTLIEGKKPWLHNDLSQTSREFLSPVVWEAFGKTRYRVLAFPIIYNQDVLGTVSLYRRSEAAAFSQEEMDYAQILVDQIAHFWGESSAKTILRRRANQVLKVLRDSRESQEEQPMYEKLLDHLHEELNSPKNGETQNSKSTVKLLRQGSLELALVAKRGAERLPQLLSINTCSISAETIQTRKAIIIKHKDKDGQGRWYNTNSDMVSSLTVPLLTPDGYCLGVVNLESSEEENFQEQDLAYVESLCEAVASNVTMLRTRTFFKRTLALSALMQTPERFLQECCRLLFDLMGYEALMVVTIDRQIPNTWKLAQLAVRDPKIHENQDAPDSFVFGQDILEWIYKPFVAAVQNPSSLIRYALEQCKENVYVPDLTQTKLPHLICQFGQETSRSQAVYLIRAGEKIIGALSVEFVAVDPLSLFQHELLEIFSSWMGFVLLGTREMEELQENALFWHQQAEIADQLRQVSHEFNSLLNNMRNALQTLERKSTGLYLPPLERLKHCIEEMRHIKLRVGGTESIRIQDCDLAELWKNVCEAHQERAQQCEVELFMLFEKEPKAPWKVRSDSQILRTVFFNLIDNALHAFEALKETHSRPRKIYLEVRERDSIGYIHRFAVCDTGPGIAPELAAHLFQFGVTTSPQGIGFGLSYTRTQLERCNAKVELDSSYTAGACFVVTLP